ncbi:hypothetical protein ACTXT7_011849 [Hymenolepis weldensis]
MDNNSRSYILLHRDEKLSEVTSEILKRQYQLISQKRKYKLIRNRMARDEFVLHKKQQLMKSACERQKERISQDKLRKAKRKQTLMEIFIKENVRLKNLREHELHQDLYENSLSGEWTENTFGHADQALQEKCIVPFILQREGKIELNKIVEAIDLLVNFTSN